MTELDLVAAVHRQRVAEVDERAAATCRAIARSVGAERERLIAVLAEAGCRVDDRGAPDTAQRHEIELPIARVDAPGVIAVLEREGYRRTLVVGRGAQRSILRTADCVTMLRTGEATTVVRLRWRPARPSTLPGRLLRPTAADWTSVELPTPLWWAYPLIRVVRLMLERLGLRSDDHSDLEPFLSTPRSLIVPILDVADVGPEDFVVDLGCGDGRVVIEAARTFGCHSLGVEQSITLVEIARRQVERSEVGDRVRITHGDGTDVDLHDVTVVVLFLPVGVAGRVVVSLLDRLDPGARVVLHEQSPLPATVPRPDSSVAVVADDALTVVHRWNVTEKVMDNVMRPVHPKPPGPT